jgi:putative phosphoribosyl transferase
MEVVVPSGATGLVVFAHGSGSGAASPRNRHVAARLREAGLGTVLVGLVLPEEGDRRFDIPLLGERVLAVIDRLREEQRIDGAPVGVFGASTGAAAALVAAADRPDEIQAVVSRGGRPDLAMDVLDRVRAPTLLIVGGEDREVLELNRRAQARMTVEAELEIVPGAGHLFEEPGALDRVADLAAGFFARHLT